MHRILFINDAQLASSRGVDGSGVGSRGYGKGRLWHMYAESDDGLEWRLPSLRQFTDPEGSTENNVFLDPESGAHQYSNVMQTPEMGLQDDKAFLSGLGQVPRWLAFLQALAQRRRMCLMDEPRAGSVGVAFWRHD